MTTLTKPVYRPTTLDEIRSTPKNGLTAVSTFTGAGGGSLGLEWSGWTVAWASEFVPAAAETYRANFETPLDERDIRNVTGSEISEFFDGELDLLEGSPPCASFSLSGSREATWGEVKKYSDTKQVVDDLFGEYARLVDELRPRAFVAENVPALTVGVARGYLKEIVERLEASGYFVTGGIVDAQWFGVPQRRKRLILVGFRKDLGVSEFVWPDPLPYRYTVAEALVDVPEPTDDERAPYGGDQAIWKEWDRLRPGEQSGRYFNLIRVDPNDVSPTVTQASNAASVASVVHGTERRKFHVTELRRICGFPDDFVLTGVFRRRIERLGRAVAPPVYRAIGARIAETLTLI